MFGAGIFVTPQSEARRKVCQTFVVILRFRRPVALIYEVLRRTCSEQEEIPTAITTLRICERHCESLLNTDNSVLEEFDLTARGLTDPSVLTLDGGNLFSLSSAVFYSAIPNRQELQK